MQIVACAFTYQHTACLRVALWATPAQTSNARYETRGTRQEMSAQERDIMEDKDVSINATAGVPQGNSKSPVLFIFYIQAVLETLDDEFVRHGVVRDKPTFSYKTDHVIHGRRWDARRGVIDMQAGECFLFTSRKSLCECAVIIDRHFTGFGLQVHRGKQGKKSKTECMYFPPAGVRYENA